MVKQETDKREQSAIEFLKSARDITFIFAVFLYFTGWIYIYAYLDKFGLTIKAVDIDIYNTLIYASNVFIYLFESPFIVICIIVILLAAVVFRSRIKDWIFRLLPVIMVAMFPLTFLLAKSAARNTAEKILKNPDYYLKKVQFTFKTENNVKTGDAVKPDSIPDVIQSNLYNQNKQSNLRFLISNKDEYYVLVNSEFYKPEHPVIYIIKKDLVNLILIK